MFRERCHANMTCVGVTLYFSARDTISGWSRTGEYPVWYEEAVHLDMQLFYQESWLTARSVCC